VEEDFVEKEKEKGELKIENHYMTKKRNSLSILSKSKKCYQKREIETNLLRRFGRSRRQAHANWIFWPQLSTFHATVNARKWRHHGTSICYPEAPGWES
jgi:hypothetical protein